MDKETQTLLPYDNLNVAVSSFGQKISGFVRVVQLVRMSFLTFFPLVPFFQGYDEKMSGPKDDRPELIQALRMLRAGDKFVVYKLDRLARSTKRLIEIADQLKGRNIEFVSLQDNFDTSTPAGKAMFGMLSVLAEFEWDIIRERTLAGLYATRARGRKGGRPKANAQKLRQAIILYKSQEMTVKEIQPETGIYPSTLYRALSKTSRCSYI
ncbi:recombinase family protein [Fictibacillus sp. FJAT-27399]|uniref:recombinase family protein n=1 Tax=Fictibacillus sp. FJAT-27399 TaxID=1729689 RepID=UPI000A872EF7|nr:recombinase family protein [Fictibacillus sp. FJAT-27399]